MAKVKMLGLPMVINIKRLRGASCKNSFFVSLIVVLLISSVFIGVLAPNAEGQSSVNVGTETELRAAVSNAATGVPVVIVLNREIGLTGGALIIPANKDITFRSNGNTDFELFGASGANTITVENRGTLTLAGITVTHVSGAAGNGVNVNSGGTLVMSGGKISGNRGGFGGSNGVSNSGTFTMSGGEISNNDYYGVYSADTFTMNGGTISSNGYGVYVYGTFNLYGGKISGNINSGVNIYSSNIHTFNMLGGEISGNGRGVSNGGTFSMSKSLFNISVITVK